MTALERIRERADAAVTPETAVDELGLDSLEFLDLLIDLGIPAEKSLELTTVADLVREATC